MVLSGMQNICTILKCITYCSNLGAVKENLGWENIFLNCISTLEDVSNNHTFCLLHSVQPNAVLFTLLKLSTFLLCLISCYRHLLDPECCITCWCHILVSYIDMAAHLEPGFAQGFCFLKSIFKELSTFDVNWSYITKIGPHITLELGNKHTVIQNTESV